MNDSTEIAKEALIKNITHLVSNCIKKLTYDSIDFLLLSEMGNNTDYVNEAQNNKLRVTSYKNKLALEIVKILEEHHNKIISEITKILD